VDEGAILLVMAMAGELAVAALIVNAFRVRYSPPAGYRLKDGVAPRLRGLVDDVADRAGVPRVQNIYINQILNACVTQIPRFGPWGRSTSHLTIGVPLLLCLTVDELTVVVAHELGHLRHVHSRINWWAYRVHSTWNVVGTALAKCKPLQRLIIGWFVERYGEFLAQSTLALRRVHEYVADQFSAQQYGADATGRTLCRIEFADYALARHFWPEIMRLAGTDPVPPQDVFRRMAEFFAKEKDNSTFQRWVLRQRRMHTPITAEHPSLMDRLASIGKAELLHRDDGRESIAPVGAASWGAAIGLLGDAEAAIVAAATAQWKLESIGRWRMEHAYAQYLRRGDRQREAAANSQADAAWRQVEFAALFGPAEQAQEAMSDHLTRYPDHPVANATLGQLLLGQDREEAMIYLGRAGSSDHEYRAHALTGMLNYYRALGHDADAIRVAEQLREVQRSDSKFNRAVTAVSARDQFGPPQLSDLQLVEIRRILYRYVRVRAAFLASRVSRSMPGRTSHVLLLRCRSRGLSSTDRLTEGLRGEIPVPCAVVIQGWRNRRLQRRIRQANPQVFFEAGD
jgi:Zn-dependent protease with chaperone function